MPRVFREDSMPRFVIRRPGEGAHVFELLGERDISIGRAKSSTLVLDHGSVSRQHALVRATPEGRWQIIIRHDTCQLPKSVAQELTQSAYSGTATGIAP